ncbi:hypothetical protein E0Z10_g7593 [Xylaria hypoxylon]|uniref:EamA domain-containing protein n=1 Tax=Xylaria hypoxylon TaxID=37992 RepID=A0A4Z0YPQ9_9PEZI|nr:hypothetical protein E0Z10_g7593 [Xylaria hypoxylon]
MARSGNPSSNPVPIPVPVTSSPSSSSSASPGPSSSAAGILKQRKPGPAVSTRRNTAEETEVVVVVVRRDGDDIMPWTVRNKWMVYAVASGACAAFNGVFAKLTTNDLTVHIAHGISGVFGFEGADRALEIIVRVIFLGLNFFFNAVMWTLFTQALASSNSTTQVSIMNTSTNFMITALLGFAIFAEALPPLWWAGATLLVVGNVIIGRRDEGDADTNAIAERSEEEEAAERGHGGTSLPKVNEEDEDEDVPLLGNLDSSLRDR